MEQELLSLKAKVSSKQAAPAPAAGVTGVTGVTRVQSHSTRTAHQPSKGTGEHFSVSYERPALYIRTACGVDVYLLVSGNTFGGVHDGRGEVASKPPGARGAAVGGHGRERETASRINSQKKVDQEGNVVTEKFSGIRIK